MVSTEPITGDGDRVAGEDRAGEDVGQGVLGVVVAHGDLFQDHHALGVDVGRRDGGVEHHLADQLDRQLRLLGQDRGRSSRCTRAR